MTAELLLEGKNVCYLLKMVRPYTPPQVCSVAGLHLLSGRVAGFLLLIFFLIGVCDEQSWDRYEK